MRLLKYRKAFYIFSIILAIFSMASILKFNLNLGIDFTGGSVLEIEYKSERPRMEEIRNKIGELEFEEVNLQPIGEKGILLRIKEKEVSKNLRENILEKMKETGEINEDSFEFKSIGPVIGKELREQTNIVVILSLIAILLYIAFAFRKVSFPLASWQYGLASLIALSFNVLVVLGVFAVLGSYYGVQFTIPIITALLAVIGYSINDTVVVFDRVRENMIRNRENYEEIVNISLNQSLKRSIHTSLTTLFVVLAIFFLGGETLKYFALTLAVGITIGTYSSLFLASPLLITWFKMKKK